MNKKKVLLTGFEPFGGETVNPAWEAVAMVREEQADARIVRQLLPVTFADSIRVVREAMQREQPDVVLCVGQAGGRSAITPERVAINIDDARIPDNAGEAPEDRPIFADGPSAYFATVPVKKMAEAIRAAGLPASVSNTAGTYVCNHVMYGILYWMEREFPRMTGGFIHVPYCTAQAAAHPERPSMAVSDIAAGLEAAVRAAVS